MNEVQIVMSTDSVIQLFLICAKKDITPSQAISEIIKEESEKAGIKVES